MLKFLRYTVEFVAAFVGFVILLVLLLAWRLSLSPLSADFLTPYIETGIETLVPGSDVKVVSSLMTWDNVEKSVRIHADDIKIDDGAGRQIGDIPSFDANISLLGLVFGQFMPKELIIDHPQARLDRTKDGAFLFGGVTVSDGDTPDNGRPQPQDNARDVLRNLSDRLSHAVLIHKLAVTDAEFDVHDEATQGDWAVKIPEISITRNSLSEIDHKMEFGALDGRMVFHITQQDANATLELHYSFDPKKVRHTFSTEFKDLTPSLLAGGHPETLGLNAAAMADLPLTGKAEVTFDKNFDIEAAHAQVHGDEGHLVYGDFWDAPLPVKFFDVNADYDRDTQKLSVTDGKIDFDGPVLALTVDGDKSEAPGKDIAFSANLIVDNMPMNRYNELWPKPVLPDPRYWLAANLRDGMFNHADVTLKGSLAWNDLANASVDEGGGKLSASGARVTYLDGMPPAENVAADAAFDLKQMSVTVKSGGLGNIRITPFTLVITGLDKVDQDIDIPLAIGGPVPDILALLDHPPLGYAKKLGIAPGDIDGAISGSVDFQFPLLKTLEMKDLKIDAKANATGVATSKLVPGVAVDQGNLAITLDMTGFNLKGQANIDKVPFQIDWQENFEEQPGKLLRQATFTGSVRDDQWPGLGVTAFAGTKGPIAVSLEMDRPSKDHTQLTGVLDMGAAAIEIDALDWKKPAGSPATFKFATDAVNGKPVDVKTIELRSDLALATGSATLSPDMTQLLSLDMPKLKVGRDDVSVHFSQTFGPSGALKFDATGKSLDISGLRGDSSTPSPADTRPQQYHILVDRLYTSADGEIDMAQGTASRDTVGWSAISLHGQVGAGKPLSIELTPQPDGHRTFSISCDDFGEAMKGLGFTNTIKGGKLSVTGQSTADNPRLIQGSAKISSFTVIKLPALALLMNATSPFGFSNIITDSADFSRFEGDYKWQGDDLTLMRAHAAGSAIGINMDGKVDVNTGVANLQGTLVPFSVMNKILNYIPLIGGILTGGDNQGVLAVAYTIQGPLGKPDISVNPVSLLTPGFIRNLFFRDDLTGEDSKPDEDTPAPEPEPAPAPAAEQPPADKP